MAGLIDLSLFATSPTHDNRFTAYEIPSTEPVDFGGSYYDQERDSRTLLAKAYAMKPLPPLPKTAICQRAAQREDLRSWCILNRMRRSRSEEPTNARKGNLQQRRRNKRSPQLTLTVPSTIATTHLEAIRSDPPPEISRSLRPGRQRVNQNRVGSRVSQQHSREHIYPSTIPQNHSQTTSYLHSQSWQHPQQYPTVYSYYAPNHSAYAANNPTYSMTLPNPTFPHQSPHTPNSYIPSFYGSTHHVTPDIYTPPLTPLNPNPNPNPDNIHNSSSNISTPLTPIRSQFLSLITDQRRTSERSNTSTIRATPDFQEAVSGLFFISHRHSEDDLAAISPPSDFDAVERVWEEAAATASTATADSSSIITSLLSSSSSSSSSSRRRNGKKSANEPEEEDLFLSESSSYSGRRAVMERVAGGYTAAAAAAATAATHR